MKNMKWVERKTITTATTLTSTKTVVELFLEAEFDGSAYGYYYHNYPDIINQNKWFIKGEIIKKGKKGFFIKLSEPEWFACREYRYIKITNFFVCDYLKNVEIQEIKNLRKVLY